MEYLVVFNPLSKEGMKEKTFTKLAKYLKIQKENLNLMSVININTLDQIINQTTPETKIILVGGDGTINRFANLLNNRRLVNPIYLFKAGTGNDFGRSINRKKRLILVNEYLVNLPKIIVNDNYELSFLNGVGLGVDGMVCHYVNHDKKAKSKLNYYKQALRAFKDSKRFDVTVTADGNVTKYDKVWLVSIMYGKYFGGGMKIAPKADRSSDYLTLVVVKKVPKWFLMLVFPTIYLGIHPMFKRYIKFIKAKNITVEASESLYAQVDGDDYLLVNKLDGRR